MARGNLQTGGTGQARFTCLSAVTIEPFRQQPGRGCLACSPNPRKEIRVMQSIAFQRVTQCLRNLLLTNQILKGLWPILSCDHLVAHLMLLLGIDYETIFCRNSRV
jgi:hypothetical protein